MKRTYKFLALMALLWPTPTWAAAISEIFPNCARPSTNPGRILAVNPQARGQGNYASVEAALQAAKPGDTISLSTGEYGDLTLIGVNTGDFITITAAPNQTPRFTKIRIGGTRPTSRWRVTGITVSGFNAQTDGHLAAITGSDNIIFDHNKLQSKEGTLDWKPYVAGSPDTPSHGISARQSSCITIQDNKIRNVFHGIEFGGDQKGNNGKFFLVDRNTIDNFAGDGIEHYGSNVRILNNRITDGHNLCDDKCVHSDGIQGWNYNHLPILNTDVVIDSNTIIAQTTPGLALPIVTLQGITIFDGQWDGVKITNNVVIVNAWHGITINGSRNVSVINNTLASSLPSGRSPWIMVNPVKSDPPGTVSRITRNNALPGTTKVDASGPGSDHNIGFRNADAFAKAFVKYDPSRFEFDMRPSRGSPVIGAGSREGAPTKDIEGRPRSGAVDIGAYAYQP